VKRILLIIICFVTAISVQAQKAKLIGKVTNVKNDVLVGVTLTLKSDKSQVSKTDIEGIL
jgi:phenylpyruvate tautomerase PptA (4-oxalocrotonate tautomerase family)